MNSSNEKRVVVIGAGLSGLSAAKWLREAGVDVVVLEARDRVGGKIYTKRETPVDYVDLGGSYIGPTQDYVIRMAKELGVETYKINVVEDTVFYNHGSRRRWRGGGWPPFWNPIAYLDVNHFFRTIDKMGKEIPLDEPWKAVHAAKWDKITLQNFMDKTLCTKTGGRVAHLFFSLLTACEPYEVSLLWSLWYIAQCGGSARVFSTRNGAQERKFKGGSQLLSDRMAEKLSENIILKAPVVSVEQKGSLVKVKTLDGTEITAAHVILALSPALQYRIHYDPPMPPLKNQLMQRMPMGSVIKVSIFYRTAFWKNLGCCGSLLITGSDDLQFPMMYALDDTKPEGDYPALTGFITGDKCRKLINKSTEERKKILCNSIAEVLKSKEALQPVHYEEYAWMNEQYSGGCYTGICPPGVLTLYGSALRKPVGRLYFAGTETAIQWSGYMDGAISAGERAAREVLYDMGKSGRDQIWRREMQSKEVQGYNFELSFWERHLPSAKIAIKLLKTDILSPALLLELKQKQIGGT